MMNVRNWVCQFVLLFVAASSALAQLPTDVLLVDKNATGTPVDGLSWDTAFRNLVDAANFYDTATTYTEIWVADGTYKHSTTGNQSATMAFYRDVRLLGGFKGAESGGYEEEASERDPSTNVVIVDGDLSGNDGSGVYTDNTYHLFESWGLRSDDTMVDGITFRGGNAADSPGTGGAMQWTYFATPGSTDTRAVISRCTFVANRSTASGGAVNCLHQPIEVRHSEFSSNEVFGDQEGHGGALNTDTGAVVISNTVFAGNTAFGDKAGGGAVFVDTGLAQLGNCTFVGNSADAGSELHIGYGGAVVLYHADDESAVVNCLFSGNDATDSGGAVFTDDDLELHQCTLSGNSAADGGGMYVDGSANVTVANSILWDNVADGSVPLAWQYYVAGSATIDVSYSCVQGIGTGGTANLDVDPQFVDADGADNSLGTVDDNCRLSSSSPVLDHGDETLRPDDIADVDDDTVYTGPHPLDLDATIRVQGLEMDMGAYELPVDDCLFGDLNEDCEVDGADLGILLAAWGTSGPGDLNGDGVVDGADLGLLLGGWTGMQGYPRDCGCSQSLMFGGGEESSCGLTCEELMEVLGFSSPMEMAEWLAGLPFSEMVELLEMLDD